MVGVGLVFFGVAADRKRFTRLPGVAATAKAWALTIRRFFVPGKSVTITVGDALTIGSSFGQGTLTSTSAWPSTVEDQASWLKEQLEKEQEDRQRGDGELAGSIRKLRSEVAEQAQGLANADVEMGRKFEDYVTGNVRLQFRGAVLVIIGVLLTILGGIQPAS